MRVRMFVRIWTLLLMAVITACQGSATSAPTETALPTRAPTIPPLSMAPPPIASPPLVPYPPPAVEATRAAEPTQESTPIPTITPTTPISDAPISTPLPDNTRTITEFYPKCSQEGFSIQCADEELGIQFQYPSRWGIVRAELINGDCGGYFYGYLFDRLGLGIVAGGVSSDYCNRSEGSLYTFFNGFKPGQGCSEFPEAQDCRQINDNVVVATIFPEYRSFCDPGPGSNIEPLMAVGINIPGDHPVSGLVLAGDFLSIKAKDQLMAPFEGVLWFPETCRDPNTEPTYNQLVEEMVLKVRQDALDEETSYKVQGIMDFANSITFTP